MFVWIPRKAETVDIGKRGRELNCVQSVCYGYNYHGTRKPRYNKLKFILLFSPLSKQTCT